MTKNWIPAFAGMTAFLLLISFSVFAAPEPKGEFIQMREAEIEAKQSRIDQLTAQIAELHKKVEDDTKEIRGAQEKIWKEFSDNLEVERGQLREQMDAVDNRQVLFQKELEKRRLQDEIRLEEKRADIDRLGRELEQLRGEVIVDRKLLNDAIKQFKLEDEAAPKVRDLKDKEREMRESLPKIETMPAPVEESYEGTVLDDGSIKISGMSGEELIDLRYADQAKPKRIRPEYYVEIGDVLLIDVWRVQDISREVTIRPDGRISLPLAGDLDVLGLNLVEIRELVTVRLSEYVRNPQVSISIRQFGGRKFIILGAINSPGVYRYQQDISLVEGIALAGGFKEDAKRGQIMIIRGDIKQEPQVKIISANMENIFRRGMISENLAVLPNDIIYVGKDFLGDYNDVINDFIKPALNTTVDFFVLRSAIRTAQDRRN